MTNPPLLPLLCCAAGAAAFQEVIDCASELLHACVIVADLLHYAPQGVSWLSFQS